MKIENYFYSVELDEQLRLTLSDKRFGGVWNSDAPFQLRYGHCWDFPLREHAEHSVECENGIMRIRFRKLDCFARFKENQYRRPLNVPDFLFEFEIRLEEETVVFAVNRIENLEEEDISLTFPNRLFRFSSGERVKCPVPCGYGAQLTFPESRREGFDITAAGSLNMTFFGILPEKKAGLAVHLKDYCDMNVHAEVNVVPGEVSFSPVFDFNALVSNYRRELRLTAMPAGSDYNRLAKWYRGIVKSEGRFVSLKEKIARSPEVEKLVGAVIWKHDVYATRNAPVPHSWSYFATAPERKSQEGLAANWTAYEIFDTAKANGFDRVCVYNAGWNRGGYDSMYPTRLPPNPERGTEAEFRAAAEYAHSLSEGYIFSVHDNYYECYRNSPEFPEEKISRDESGALRRGGIWRGGRAWHLCSDFSLEYAERDLPRIAELTGRGSIYLDVFGSAVPLSCFHPEHRHGQREDYASRRKVLKLAKQIFGSVATEQSPHEYCADIVDLGAFCPVGGTFLPQCRLPLIPVPLWQLVFHDSVLNYTADSESYGIGEGEYPAYCALYALLPTGFDAESLKQSREMRGTFTAEMLRHEFLTEPEFDGRRLHAVARTVFSDGTVVTANIGCTPFTLKNGRTLKTNEFFTERDGRPV